MLSGISLKSRAAPVIQVSDLWQWGSTCAGSGGSERHRVLLNLGCLGQAALEREREAAALLQVDRAGTTHAVSAGPFPAPA